MTINSLNILKLVNSLMITKRFRSDHKKLFSSINNNNNNNNNNKVIKADVCIIGGGHAGKTYY